MSLKLPKVGSRDPVILELDYEDWKRLINLSNKDENWITKFYNTILEKAGLVSVQELRDLGNTLDITQVVMGGRAYKRFYIIGREKYGEVCWAMINLDVGPSEFLKESDPKITATQILIRPEALGSLIWQEETIID